MAWGDAIAITSSWILNGLVVETDVTFDLNRNWNAFTGPLLPASGGGTLYDFFRVALHEFGHAAGLGHPDEAGQTVVALMNRRASDVDRLQADDIAGAHAVQWFGPTAQPLSASATASPTSGTAPLTVSFTASVSGGIAPYTFAWTFGDGQASTLQNPAHTYLSPGTFNVTVTATDAGSRTVVATATVVVTSPPPPPTVPVDTASPGIITTVAGAGPTRSLGGFSGDGGPATSAQLAFPSVAVDASGNIFIADSYNHRIRKVAAGSGIITTVAGTGAFGFSGDGGPATSAQLDKPAGVALDASGNLFIADRENHRVRKVAAGTGLISTVAGSGGEGGFSGDGGPATSAQLAFPSVAVNGRGNLFIADSYNHRVRRVATGDSSIPGPVTCPDSSPAFGSSLIVSQSHPRVGDNITISATGTAGETAVIAFSRRNSGASFRGQSLLLGIDLGVLFACQLEGLGSCSQRFIIPPSTSGTFFFQAARSSDPTLAGGTFSLTNGACITIR